MTSRPIVEHLAQVLKCEIVSLDKFKESRRADRHFICGSSREAVERALSEFCAERSLTYTPHVGTQKDSQTWYEIRRGRHRAARIYLNEPLSYFCVMSIFPA